MMRSSVVLAISIVWLSNPMGTAAQAPSAFIGATIIDGRGGPPIRDGVLLVANGRVTAVGPRGKVAVPAGAREISAAGKYIIPGLMDANVHLVYGASIEFMARYEGRFEELITEAAQVTLKNGLTTVFDSWGPLQPLIKVRDRLNRGEIPGSRLFVAGNIIGFTGPFGRDFSDDAERQATKGFRNRINSLYELNSGPELMWLTPDSLRVEIRKYLANGVDFIKYAVSGHTQMEMLMFSPEQQRVIVEEGHKAGVIVETHTTSIESLRQALDVGVELLQHGSFTGLMPIPASLIARLESGRTYCAIQSLTRKRLGIMVEFRKTYPPRVHYPELTMREAENDAALIRAGVPLLLGTDAGIMDPDQRDDMPANLHEDESTALGDAHFLWFQAVKEKGMKPMDAILAATRNIAAAYHKLDDFGTLEPGKRADLVVLQADPLEDLMNLRKIDLVMKDGVVVDRDALPVKRILTAR
jgi:imidazolonepropionase-like amidohydrolase